MNKKQKKEKKPKTFLWYLDKLLMLAVAAIIITGLVIWVSSADNDDMEMMLIAIAMLPGAGLLITPNIIMYAIKDSRGWKDRMLESKLLLKEDFFQEIIDTSSYHKRICKAVIREAFMNFLALIVLIAVVFVGTFFHFENGATRYQGENILILIGIIILIAPMFAYNVTCAVYRIRTVQRCEYLVYRSKVKTVDGYNMKIVGKHGTYKFKYCKCLGIRADDVYETDAILIFVPDEVYLLPDEER